MYDRDNQIAMLIGKTIKSEAVDQCVQAVISSVKWLDEHKPGWASKINLEEFEFILGDRCIAGQLGLKDKEIEQSQGFDSPLRADHEDLNFSYAHMDSLWRVFIQKRLDHVIPQANS